MRISLLGQKAAFRLVGSIVIGIGLSTSVPVGATAQTANADQTEAKIQDAMAGYNRFQSSHAVQDLRQAAFALSYAIDQRATRTGDVIGHRRSVVAAFAKVLREFDALVDPTFDPSNPPSLCVTPPREPDGRQAPACAAPGAVLDPAARAQYQAAIDANLVKIQHYNDQAKIANASNDTLSLLEIVLHRFHARAPSDSAALDQILMRSGLSEARRTKIHQMF
jgi:hypothetical protein